MPAAPMAPNHRELKSMTVFSGSRILKICVLVGAGVGLHLLRASGAVAWRSCRDGSPIIPVKSPIRKMAVCPSCWNWRILLMSTVWPRCRSGAVGSKPALTRSGLPRASFFDRSASVRSSEAPRRNSSSCSCRRQHRLPLGLGLNRGRACILPRLCDGVQRPANQRVDLLSSHALPSALCFPGITPVTRPFFANAAAHARLPPRSPAASASSRPASSRGAILAAVGAQIQNPLLDPALDDSPAGRRCRPSR